MELNKEEIEALQKRYDEIKEELEKKAKAMKKKFGTDILTEILEKILDPNFDQNQKINEIAEIIDGIILLGMVTMMKDFFGEYLPDDQIGLD